ncbi:MAG: hypothetical protein R3C32_13200 [Chloroflexota bacterium]
MGDGSEPVRFVGWLLLSALVVGTLLGWLWRFRPGLWHRNRALLFVGLVLVGSALVLAVTADRSVLPYLAPFATGALLLSVLLDAGVALVVLGVVATLGGAMVGQPQFAVYLLLGGLAGIVVVRRGERLTQYVQAGVAMAVVNVGVVSAFGLLDATDLAGLFQLELAALASAAGSAIAAAGTFAVAGSVFGITTSYQLMELANPRSRCCADCCSRRPGRITTRSWWATSRSVPRRPWAPTRLSSASPRTTTTSASSRTQPRSSRTSLPAGPTRTTR